MEEIVQTDKVEVIVGDTKIAPCSRHDTPECMCDKEEEDERTPEELELSDLNHKLHYLLNRVSETFGGPADAVAVVMDQLAKNPDEEAVLDLSPTSGYNDSSVRMAILFALNRRGFLFNLSTSVEAEYDDQGFMLRGRVAILAHVTAGGAVQVAPYHINREVAQFHHVARDWSMHSIERRDALIAAIDEYERYLGMPIYGPGRPGPDGTEPVQ